MIQESLSLQRSILKSITYIGFLFFVAFLCINIHVRSSALAQIFDSVAQTPAQQTAIILGALVEPTGALSPMVKDRCDTGVDLYNQGKVKKILISGDHGRKYYDEVNAMKDYILSQGVPGEDVFMDHAGFDTYDSLYRAREIFQIESAVIVTQGFHLPRSLYIANMLGVKAVGVKADRQDYGPTFSNWSRELLSSVKAAMDVTLQSGPKYLGDAIPITGDSSLSWD